MPLWPLPIRRSRQPALAPECDAARCAEPPLASIALAQRASRNHPPRPRPVRRGLHPRRRAAGHRKRDARRGLQGAIPERISRLIAEHDTFLDHFDPDSTPVRVVLSLRDDYVYALNRWKRHLPALGQNNFELRALRGPAAFDAVFKPGELRCQYRGEVNAEHRAETGLLPIVSEETAQRIVRFVAEKKEDVPLEEIEAVPPILSLLCRELNLRRFTACRMPKSAAQITFREGDKPTSKPSSPRSTSAASPGGRKPFASSSRRNSSATAARASRRTSEASSKCLSKGAMFPGLQMNAAPRVMAASCGPCLPARAGQPRLLTPEATGRIQAMS